MSKQEKQTSIISMGGRIPLAQNVPLEKPRCIRINPTTACNLRCQFCAFSQEDYRIKNPPRHLALDEFKNMADDVKKSFGKVKNVKLVGMGEPLAHPQFPEMVAYLSEHDICEVSETITNGVLLTPELSDKLIEANLSLLKISVNGMSDEEYLEHCGKEVSFSTYVENIRYFFQNKKNTKVYIKIINYMVPTEQSRNYFIETFSPIADAVNIENLVELNDSESYTIDYDAFAGDYSNSKKSTLNYDSKGSQICNLPYYNMRLSSGGVVTPCCYEGAEFSVANREGRALRDIWETDFYSFQRRMLSGFEHAAPFCHGCTSFEKTFRPEDRLDEAATQLMEKYNKKIRMTDNL